MNVCIFSGFLSNDPELNQTTDGQYVCRFSIAVKRPFSKETDFFNCVAWRKKAEFIYQYFRKGKPIEIKGYISNRQWTDSKNQKRSSTEITVDDAGFSYSEDNKEDISSKDKAVLSPTTGTNDNSVPLPFIFNNSSSIQQPAFPSNSNTVPINVDDDLPF